MTSIYIITRSQSENGNKVRFSSALVTNPRTKTGISAYLTSNKTDKNFHFFTKCNTYLVHGSIFLNYAIFNGKKSFTY